MDFGTVETLITVGLKNLTQLKPRGQHSIEEIESAITMGIFRDLITMVNFCFDFDQSMTQSKRIIKLMVVFN